MALTYVQIGSTVTVGSGGASSIDFSSIPSTYTDLVLKVSAKTNRTDYYYTNGYVRFNGSSSGLSFRDLYGEGSGTPSSNSNGSVLYMRNAGSVTSSTFQSYEMYIPNYAGSTYKSVSVDNVIENNATTGMDQLQAGLWAGGSAINQITLYASDSGYNFVQYTTASLYGIKNS